MFTVTVSADVDVDAAIATATAAAAASLPQMFLSFNIPKVTSKMLASKLAIETNRYQIVTELLANFGCQR